MFSQNKRKNWERKRKLKKYVCLFNKKISQKRHSLYLLSLKSCLYAKMFWDRWIFTIFENLLAIKFSVCFAFFFIFVFEDIVHRRRYRCLLFFRIHSRLPSANDITLFNCMCYFAIASAEGLSELNWTELSVCRFIFAQTISITSHIFAIPLFYKIYKLPHIYSWARSRLVVFVFNMNVHDAVAICSTLFVSIY